MPWPESGARFPLRMTVLTFGLPGLEVEDTGDAPPSPAAFAAGGRIAGPVSQAAEPARQREASPEDRFTGGPLHRRIVSPEDRFTAPARPRLIAPESPRRRDADVFLPGAG